MTDQRPHVVVIGGGYAGAVAANRLQQNAGVDITLVNPRPKFVQRLGCTSSRPEPAMPPPTPARCSATVCS